MQYSKDILFTVICPNLIITENVNSSKNTAIILEEIEIYENFLTSMKQYLQSRYDDTISDVSQNLVNAKDSAVLIKEIITNPTYLERVLEQLNKQVRNLIKSIRTISNQLLTNTAFAQISSKIKDVVTSLTEKITQSLRIQGWKGFLYSLGLYCFSKFILNKFTEYKDSANEIITFFTSGATEKLSQKLLELSQMILNITGTTMSEFMAFFTDMAEVSKIFVSILAYVKRKLEFGNELNLQNAPQVKMNEDAVGRIVKGVNTTVDVGPNEISKQASKFGNKVSKDGYPPLLHKKATKNTTPNKLYNMGLAEGHAYEPHEKGYQHDLLTMPKYTLVINTPSDLDWYKIGQHYTNLSKEDPDEFNQEDSDMVIIPANRKELEKLKAMLDRVNMKYKEIGGSPEHPEMHMEGIMFKNNHLNECLKYNNLELSIMEGGHQLEEDWKTNLKRLVTAGALSAVAAGAISTKSAYDKWVASHQNSPIVAKIEQPDRPISYTPAAKAKVDTSKPTSTKSDLAPKTSIRPIPRPDSITQNASDQELAPKTSIRPVPRPDFNITFDPKEKLLIDVVRKAGISGVELAAFLSQAAHETGYYDHMTELGDKEYFNKYDPKFAPNKARELGNTSKGDGYKYRGRGYLHLTGKENYEMAGKALGLPLVDDPDLASNPRIAAYIAVWYWANRVRPNVSDFSNVEQVTTQINPGMAGMDSRETKFKEYLEVMSRSNNLTTENINKNILTEKSIKLSDLAEIKTKFENADFWITRRNTIDRVGMPTKTYNPENIGIKVIRTDILLPSYLYYVIQYLHSTGHFKSIAHGATNLVSITTNDVKNLSFALNESFISNVKSLIESEIVDLDKKREDKKISDFHKGFMGDIKTAAQEKVEAYNIAQEEGLFNDLPIGSRFTLSNGASYKVTNHGMTTHKTNVLPKHQEEFRIKHKFGPAKFIEYNGKYFKPVIYTEEVAGEMSGSNSGFELDKLINFETGEKRYTKFTGPKRVSEKKKPNQVKGNENLPKISKPSNSGFQSHPYTGRLVGEAIGYKVMAFDPKKATAYSLADDKITIPLKIGKEITMNGNGIYLSNSEEFVKNYYSGLTDNDEVLIKFEYDPSNIISGSDQDKESEFTVKSAKILGVKVISENISRELLNIIKENMSVTGTERARLARKKGIEPGTDEWFEHWFSLPYMIDQRKKKHRPRGMGVKPS